MSIESVLTSLAIPSGALVDQRVPKKLLLAQEIPTAADKRQLQDGIAGITWVAALKPTNIGVPAFCDEAREYSEIAIVSMTLRHEAKLPRIIELMHRAIPYPLVLIADLEGAISLSLAHKRWSQGEPGKVVIEEVRQVRLSNETPTVVEAEFLSCLPVSRLPSRDLFALYSGLFARLIALEVSRISNRFVLHESDETTQALRNELEARSQLQRELSVLRSRAEKEKQINRLVVLNLKIRELEDQLSNSTINENP